MDSRKYSLNDIYIYLIGVFAFFWVYSTTVCNNIIRMHNKIVFIFTIIFCLFKIMFDHHSNLELLIIPIIICLACIISFLSKDLTVITTILLIIAAKNVNFKKIIKSYFYGIAIVTIPVILLSLLHILPNETYMRAGMIRNSFGFTYPTTLSEMICILSICYCVINYNKINYLHILILILLTYFIIHFTITKMDYYCMILLIIVIFINKKDSFLLDKIPLNLSWMFLPVMSFLSFFYAYRYTFFNPFYDSLNRLLEGRVMFSNIALRNDKISFLGQRIYENASNGDHIEHNMMYFFIDQSVIRMAVIYGIVLLLIFIIFYTYKMLKLQKIGLNYLVLFFGIIVIRGFVDPSLINIIGDPFLLILLANVNDFIYIKDKESE